ncbi:MAG: hypothetical protein WC312_07315 [Candidatus Omnitrophota bacterium]|jgi:hypothetical protein
MELAQVIAIYGIMIFLSWLSFRFMHPCLLIILFGDAYITGLYTPDIICGPDATNGLAITIGFMLIIYAIFCAGMAFKEMFYRGDEE